MVARVTLAFWIIKILATTLGETGGDALSMTLKLGYAISSLILLGFFCVTLAAQIVSKRYHPVFCWAVVVATTTVGTTTSDYLDRTLGLGYIKSSIMLFVAVIALLVVGTTRRARSRLTPSPRGRTSFSIGLRSSCRTHSAPHWVISSPRRPGLVSSAVR